MNMKYYHKGNPYLAKVQKPGIGHTIVNIIDAPPPKKLKIKLLKKQQCLWLGRKVSEMLPSIKNKGRINQSKRVSDENSSERKNIGYNRAQKHGIGVSGSLLHKSMDENSPISQDYNRNYFSRGNKHFKPVLSGSKEEYLGEKMETSAELEQFNKDLQMQNKRLYQMRPKNMKELDELNSRTRSGIRHVKEAELDNSVESSSPKSSVSYIAHKRGGRKQNQHFGTQNNRDSTSGMRDLTPKQHGVKLRPLYLEVREKSPREYGENRTSGSLSSNIRGSGHSLPPKYRGLGRDNSFEGDILTTGSIGDILLSDVMLGNRERRKQFDMLKGIGQLKNITSWCP